MAEGVSVVEGRSRRVGRGVPERWARGAGLYFVWQQAAVERKDTVLDVSEQRPGASADAGAAGAAGAAAAADTCSLTHLFTPGASSALAHKGLNVSKVWLLCQTRAPTDHQRAGPQIDDLCSSNILEGQD